MPDFDPAFFTLDLQMPFAKITRAERALLIGAVAVACLVGGLAAFAAYQDEAEAQFHGGVLPEDAAEANLALVWEPTFAFARWGLGIFLAVGIAPIGLTRFIKCAGK